VAAIADGERLVTDAEVLQEILLMSLDGVDSLPEISRLGA